MHMQLPTRVSNSGEFGTVRNLRNHLDDAWAILRKAKVILILASRTEINLSPAKSQINLVRA